ncbi:MAG: hypothetical protein M3O30_00380 [Planctomycetota bacterium]|nr:hypothetical protein [Planctomycetota bacterium]
MADSELQRRVLTQLNLRIEKNMTNYLGKKLAEGGRPFTIIGGDARTGVPRRQVIEPQSFLSPFDPPLS